MERVILGTVERIWLPNPTGEPLTSDSVWSGLKNATGMYLRCLSYLECDAVRGYEDLHQLTRSAGRSQPLVCGPGGGQQRS